MHTYIVYFFICILNIYAWCKKFKFQVKALATTYATSLHQ